jgi:5-methylcytosine-specific restriction endonuclease McrA
VVEVGRTLQALLRIAVETDTEARFDGQLWQTRCLHCRAHLALGANGEPLGSTSLEHIVPRSWFGRRAAAALVARVGQADAAMNLALACARCNQQKGRGPDAAGPADPDAVALVAALLERRRLRYPETSS